MTSTFVALPWVALLALAVLAVPAMAAAAGAPGAHGVSGAESGKAVSAAAQPHPGSLTEHTSGGKAGGGM